MTGKEREKDSDRKKKKKERKRRRHGEMETRDEREKVVLQTERDVLGGERKVNTII